MAFFYSSAFSKGKGPSAETQALKNATIFLNKKKTENYGVIADPKVYDEVIQKYLSPFSDNLTVQSAITGYQADAAKLAEKSNDEEFKISTLQNNLNEQQLQLGKKFKDSPGDIILQTTQLYDQAVRKLRQEAEINRSTGGSYGKLEGEAQKLEAINSKLQNLAGAVVAGTDNPEMTGNFGFYINTDPNTGKIISMTLNPTDSSPTGYMRTDSFYGNTPVYAKGVRNPYADNKLQAKIGNQTYVAEAQQTETGDTTSGTLNQTVLKLQNPKDISGKMSAGDKFANVFRAGEKQKKFDVSKGAYDINLGGTDFISNSYVDFPNNSIARDTNRNVYLKNDAGKWVKFDNLDTLSQVLQKPKAEIEASVKDITNQDAKSITDYSLFDNNMLKSPGASTLTSSPATPAPNPAPTTPPVEPPPSGNPSTPPAQQTPQGKELQNKNIKNIVSGNSVKNIISSLNPLNLFK